MKKTITTLLMLCLYFYGCGTNDVQQEDGMATWKLGWRMTESAILENYELSVAQFDSLLATEETPSYNFLKVGLRSLNKVGKDQKMETVLLAQEEAVRIKLCQKDYLRSTEGCKGIAFQEPDDKRLSGKLLKMHAKDQSFRGNFMKEFEDKYQLDTIEYSSACSADIDLNNQCLLQEIIKEHGFPTLKLVGYDALYGVFLIIQHADKDPEWQNAQLPYIKAAAEKGELDGRWYAYLIDRTAVNAEELQVYGTQFAKVDATGVELRPLQDPENLDVRRRQIGLMPIEMYKRFMLRGL
jgi:hypothetical protein